MQPALSHLITVLICTLFAGHISAQSPPLTLTSPPSATSESTITTCEQWIDRFEIAQRYAFDEKLYIHTDKELYSAADTIFLKGYLLEPYTLAPARSAFIYVELINNHKEVLARHKFKGEKGAFAGQFPLKETLNEGTYQLRAYTWWMQKYDEAFFFKKNIHIGNALGLQVSSFVTYRKTPKGELEATVTLLDRHKIPIPHERVKVEKIAGNSVRTVNIKTDLQGELSFSIPETMVQNDSASFRITTESNLYHYTQKYSLPTKEEQIAVQFFPESGHLVSDEPQIVAFKAIDTQGLSVNINGHIISNMGDTVANITTSHNGMGKFLFVPMPHNTYRAVVSTEASQVYTFDLPQPSPAVTLKCISRKNRVATAIINKTTIPSDSLFLLIHNRGKLLICHSLAQIPNGQMQIAMSSFQPGISSMVVVNSNGNALAERLFFAPPSDSIHLALSTPNTSYSPREKVNAHLSIAHTSGTPIGGNFSVSVTNSRLVPTNKWTDNICSYLHLTSDIKGHIEDPRQYFDINDPSRLEKLDILLLTQGWRRYDLTKILQRQDTDNKFYLELGQALAGKVNNFIGRKKAGANVFLFSPQKGDFYTTTTKENGAFIFDGIVFEDSTQFVIKTVNPKALVNTLSISLEKQSFPPPQSLPPQRNWVDENTAREYLFSVKERIYTVDGLRMVELQEVEILANKKEEFTISSSMMAFASNTYSQEQLKRYDSYTIEQFLSTIPKINKLLTQTNQENEKVVSYIDNSDGSISEFIESDFYGIGPIIYIVNDQPTDLESLKGTPMSSVQSVAVITDAATASMYGSTNKPIVVFILKEGEELNHGALHSSIAITMPLGYTKAAEFYQPQYDINPQLRNLPDHRTTIYWHPNLNVPASTGSVDFNFFTAQRNDPCRIVIEGITSDGIPLYFQTTLPSTSY